MRDITLCVNDKCPSKNFCFRYADPREFIRHQRYTRFELKEDETKCENFYAKRQKV